VTERRVHLCGRQGRTICGLRIPPDAPNRIPHTRDREAATCAHCLRDPERCRCPECKALDKRERWGEAFQLQLLPRE
jgi:hypothetical protein